MYVYPIQQIIYIVDDYPVFKFEENSELALQPQKYKMTLKELFQKENLFVRLNV